MRKQSYRTRRDTLIEYILRKMEKDHAMTIMATVVLTSIGILSILAGVTIWPIIFQVEGAAASLAPFCMDLKMAGMLMIAVLMVTSFAAVILQHTEFSGLKCACVNLLIGGFIMTISCLMNMDVLTMIHAENFVGHVLWGALSFFMGYILSVFPALAISGLAKIGYCIINALLP